MTNYKVLVSRIVYCASADNCDGCPLDSDDTSEICVDKLLKKAADAIEQLCKDVARLEAENRGKEQYIADTIGKVIKERNAEVSGMCIFRITGYESSESRERYQYSSDAPVDVTVFAKSKKEAIEKAEKILGCPISTTHRHIVMQEIEHETECSKTFVDNKYWLRSHDGSADDAEYYKRGTTNV